MIGSNNFIVKNNFLKKVNISCVSSIFRLAIFKENMPPKRKIGRKLITDTDKESNDEPQILKRSKLENVGIILNREFFDVECKKLANDLLGKVLVRQIHGKRLSGRIVETECYLGAEDKASHSYNYRKTPSNEPMYMEPGTLYVYMTYGMYFCMNISSQGPGAAVLLRSLEPLEGIEEMNQFRLSKRKSKTEKKLKETQLCNGPSKLCMSLSIDKESCNKIDLCESDKMWIEDSNFSDFKTVVSTRIGIQSVEKEWRDKPLRFYIHSNPHVSVRDKTAEKLLET